VDASYYEDLAGRLYGLLIMLEDRLGREQVQLFHHFIEVGEYGLALEEIAGALAQDTIAITDQERGDMLTLARRMEMDNLVPHALESCPRGGDKSGQSSHTGPDGAVEEPERTVRGRSLVADPSANGCIDATCKVTFYATGTLGNSHLLGLPENDRTATSDLGRPDPTGPSRSPNERDGADGNHRQL
jgi:hypothetical protein